MRRPSSVGVDISDSSIKVLQLDPTGTVVAYGSGSLKEGVVSNGFINDKVLFAEALNEILKNTKPSALSAKQESLRAVLCLPEAKLFTHHTKLPKHIKKVDIEEFIHEDAKKMVPLELDDMYWDYHVSEKNNEKYVTFVGAPKSTVDNYVEALTFSDVKPALIVGELFSLAHAVSPDAPISQNYMIADIGARTTNIGTFFVDTVATMSVTVPSGGNNLTQALVEALQLSTEEAETQKRNIGVTETAADSNVQTILKNTLTDTITALREAKNHFEAITEQPVSYLVLAGGTALLPGLPGYFASELGIEARVADPFLKIKNGEIIKTDSPGIFFSNVIGLALQSLNERMTHFNLLTQYRYSENEQKRESLEFRDVQSVVDVKYLLHVQVSVVRNFVRRVITFVSLRINPKLCIVSLFLIGTIAFLGWVVVSYT